MFPNRGHRLVATSGGDEADVAPGGLTLEHDLAVDQVAALGQSGHPVDDQPAGLALITHLDGDQDRDAAAGLRRVGDSIHAVEEGRGSGALDDGELARVDGRHLASLSCRGASFIEAEAFPPESLRTDLASHQEF